jgi:hypothetical protein
VLVETAIAPLVGDAPADCDGAQTERATGHGAHEMLQVMVDLVNQLLAQADEIAKDVRH